MYYDAPLLYGEQPNLTKDKLLTHKYKRTTLEAWPSDYEAAQWLYKTTPPKKHWLTWVTLALIFASLLLVI